MVKVLEVLRQQRVIPITLFVVYLVVLMKVIVFKSPIDFTFNTDFFAYNSNFIPLKTVIGYLSGEPSWHIAIRNLLGNILLFVPFGVFLPLIFRTITLKRVLISALLFSLALETLQVFLIGTPDIDDLLLNVLGAIIGYCALCLLRK